MANLVYTPISAHVVDGNETIYRSVCEQHQWAAEGPSDIVEALVREHVREHPYVHCPPPPTVERTWPQGQRQALSFRQYVWTDGTVTYCGYCGLCSGGWPIIHSAEPVTKELFEHWRIAHAHDFGELGIELLNTEEHHG